MAPKAAILESALLDAAQEIFRTDPDNLTVNAVRNLAEDQLGLNAGFFKADTWKSKSKELITTTANKLLDDAEGVGKQACEDKEDQRDKKTEKKTKRTKQQQAARKAPEKDALGVDDGSVSPKVKLPSQKRKLAKKITTDSREGQEYSSDDTKKSTRKRGDGDEDKPAERGEEEPFGKRKKAKFGKEAPKSGTSSPVGKIDNGNDVPGPKSKPKQSTTKAAVSVDVGDISDGSSTSVLDDTPPPKRKSKPSKQPLARPATQKGTAATDSPDEAEVKKLQGQLAKCGVRKIWGFELKRFGDDVKAKIRHLKGMLRDAGMDGRFSEAKAREIKERRELMADLEGVQEMNRNWGVNGSGRASRSRAVKPSREESSEEADEGGIGGDTEDEAEAVAHGNGKNKSNGHGDSKEKEGADDDDDDGPKVRARGRQSARQADLAFLGSDSESD